MAIETEIGNYRSVFTGGFWSADPATDPSADFLEVFTRGWWGQVDGITSTKIHYAVEIDVSDNTDIPDEQEIGLFNDALLNGGAGGSAFRWVTERPDYDGSTVVPTGELSTANATKWGEGMLSKNQDLGSPIRMIDIIIAGNYGSLSGFSFSVNNVKIESGNFAGEMFFDILDDNTIYILNRKVRFYEIINDVFYNVWAGIVSKVDHDELKYTFICEDDFKNIHKVIPPEVANETLFPNIIKKSIGKPVPVALGDVNHAQLLNIQTKNDPINIFSKNGKEFTTAPIKNIADTVDVNDVFQYGNILILIGQKTFDQDFFVGLHVRINGEGGTDNFYKIRASGNTVFSAEFSMNQVNLSVETKPETDDVVFYDVTPALFGTYTKRSWVEVFDFSSKYVVSNKEIADFPNSDLGFDVTIEYLDKDKEEFVDLSEAGELNSTTNIENTGFPGIIAFTDVNANNGNFFKFINFKPKTITLNEVRPNSGNSLVSSDFGSPGVELPNLSDKNRTSKYTAVFSEDSDNANGSQVFVLLEIPDGLRNADFDEIFVSADWDLTMEHDSEFSIRNKKGLQLFPVDINDFGEIQRFITEFEYGKFTAATTEEQRMIPPDYYNEQGIAPTLFGALRNDLNMAEFYSDPATFKAYPYVLVAITVFNQVAPGSLPSQRTIDLYEVCFSGLKKINISDDFVYARVRGEKFDGSNNTNNALYTFRHLLENYDLISSSDVDATDISSRASWKTGRQLIERKSSFTYLKQLAQQTFTGIYPSRAGKRKMKAFREFETVIKAFAEDNGTILKDSISRFELSPINKVYNEFDIQYEQNVANKRFDKSVFIKNVDQSSFPTEFESTGTDTSYTSWTTLLVTYIDNESGGAFGYVDWTSHPVVVGERLSLNDPGSGLGKILFGFVYSVSTNRVYIAFQNTAGLVLNDSTTTGTIWIHDSFVQKWPTYAGGYNNYNRASSLWTACRNSYLKTLVVRRLPDEYAKCPWFIDETEFDGDPGDNSTAHKYLDLCIEWSTRQKEIVEFSIPITVENVQLELLDFCTFRDQKYTAGELRNGYITKIKSVPAKDIIILELTMIPADIESVNDCRIVETGLQTDTITESGSESDTYTEPGSC